MSPATMPWLEAPMVTAASPVTMPARAVRSWPRAPVDCTTSSAARTARWASSSRAIGVPHTAITASPMNFSTVPPWRAIASLAASKYCCWTARTRSGSRPSAKVVNPTRSAKRTVTCRRSAVGGWAVSLGGGGRSARRRTTRRRRRRLDSARRSSGRPRTAPIRIGRRTGCPGDSRFHRSHSASNAPPRHLSLGGA